MKSLPEKFSYRDLLKRDEMAPQVSSFLHSIFIIIVVSIGINALLVLFGLWFGEMLIFLKIGLLLSVIFCPILAIFLVYKKGKKKSE